MSLERYDRQQRIKGWDQKALDNAVLTIVGENNFSQYLAIASAALGVGKIRLLRSAQDPVKPGKPFNLDTLPGMMQKVNPVVQFESYETPFVVPAEDYFLQESRFVVNASQRYDSIGITAAYCLAKGVPFEVVRFHGKYGNAFLGVNEKDDNPAKLDQYSKEKTTTIDDVAAMAAAGAVLEEVKQALMGGRTERTTFGHEFPRVGDGGYKCRALVVGAGALGNIVAPLLALLGVKSVTIMDPDTIENVNLNRQIFFYDAIGKPKAQVLADRCATMGSTDYKGIVDKFTEKTDPKGYDVVFDCIDNFEARRTISMICSKAGIPLISGGTNYHSGQVIAQVPKKTTCIRHALDLDTLIEQRKAEEKKRTGCLYQPDPSVIMSNQVTGSLIVGLFRQLMQAEELGMPLNGITKYDAKSPYRFGTVPLSDTCGD